MTATPLQLQRHELFSLVEMLNPILFASEEDFISHLRDLSGLNRLVEELTRDGLTVKLSERAKALLGEQESDLLSLEVEELIDRLRARHRLSEVLIRNRRAVIGGFLPRKAFRWEVEITEEERAVQIEMDSIIDDGYREAERTQRTSVGFLMGDLAEAGRKLISGTAEIAWAQTGATIAGRDHRHSFCGGC